jgi:hypothetical protein
MALMYEMGMLATSDQGHGDISFVHKIVDETLRERNKYLETKSRPSSKENYDLHFKLVFLSEVN